MKNKKVGRPKTLPKQIRITITIDEEFHKHLIKEANRKDMSISALVRDIIKERT
jgi:predicted DNA-binding ribbon-helix-helix protein